MKHMGDLDILHEWPWNQVMLQIPSGGKHAEQKALDSWKHIDPDVGLSMGRYLLTDIS